MDSPLVDPQQLLLIYLPLLVILLILSAMFSAAETALFSLSKLRVKQLEEESGGISYRIWKLLQNPHKLLVNILVGNLFVNTIASTIAAGIAQGIGGDKAISISAGVMVLLLLVFGEITPKIISVSKPEKVSGLLSFPISLFSILVRPISEVLEKISNMIIRMMGLPAVSAQPPMTEDEIKSVLNIGVELGIIEGERGEMLSSALEFCDTRVREIMTPRTDMTFLKGDETIEECFSLIRNTGFSRFPVSDKSVDSVIGVLYVKDILPYKIKGDMNVPVKNLVRPAYFVPETKTIDQLMKTFQKKKIQMAIVVDEYGGTEGLITMEDILEEIVGDILDEYDEEETMIRKHKDGLIVDARMNVHDMAEELGFTVSEDADYETVGGLLLALFGRIPEAGEQVEDGDFIYRVLEVEDNRILQIRITGVDKSQAISSRITLNDEVNPSKFDKGSETQFDGEEDVQKEKGL